MAKAKPIKKLKKNTRAGKALALVLQSRFKDLLAELPRAYAGEVEGLHDARVAAKRMREALRLASGLAPGAKYRAFLARLQQLNDHLGAVRDRDVLLAHLGELVKASSPRPVAFTALVKRLQAERATAFKELLPVLEAFGRQAPLLAQALVSSLEKQKRGGAGAPVVRLVHRQLGKRLAQLFDNFFPEELAFNPVRFHQARIAVKKARYCLEPWIGLLPKGARLLRDQLARLQELMGQAHDWDLARAALAKADQAAALQPFLAAASVQSENYTQSALALFKQLSYSNLKYEVLTQLL